MINTEQKIHDALEILVALGFPSTQGTSSRKRFDNKFDSFAESEQPLSRVDFFAYTIV